MALRSIMMQMCCCTMQVLRMHGCSPIYSRGGEHDSLKALSRSRRDQGLEVLDLRHTGIEADQKLGKALGPALRELRIGSLKCVRPHCGRQAA